jgi:2,3-dihydroxybiphenyl 1,2-dioxygenase
MIDSLAYIGFTSPAHDAWREFGSDVLGMQLAPDGADGAVRLRLDDRSHRIAIHPGEVDDLAYIGWSVNGPDGLAVAVERVCAAGIEVHDGDAELARERRVAAIAWFVDVVGFRHELTWGQEHRPGSFRPGRPLSGFVTGSGGLGHLVLFVPDLAVAEAFYTGVLGFKISDQVLLGPVVLRFLHCNERHHTIAIGGLPGVKGVHHLMVELSSLDDVGIAYDLCRSRGIPLAMDLGRHTNDRMTSFYVRTPSGFEIEYGFGGVLVDDTWSVDTYDAISIWGHKPPAQPLRPGLIRPVTTP